MTQKENYKTRMSRDFLEKQLEAWAGAALKDWREAHGLTATDVAKACQVRYDQIYKLEEMRMSCNASVLLKYMLFIERQDPDFSLRKNVVKAEWRTEEDKRFIPDALL